MEESKKLVVMIEGRFAEGGTQGAGIVFHVDAQGRAWIVTANHVVRRNGAAATGLEVRFYGQPLEDVQAVLRKEQSTENDVGVLVASAPAGMRFPFDRVAHMSQLREGSPVRAVGYPDGSKRWGQTYAASAITDLSAMRIRVEAPTIRRGHSGGALVEGQHLVAGMVLNTDGVTAEALRIDQMIELLRRDLKLPVTLGSAAAPIQPIQQRQPVVTAAPKPESPQAGATRTNPKDGLVYVWIPDGTFRMGCSANPVDPECAGDESPAHTVTLSKGFWMGQTEVTQAAYQRLMRKNPSSYKGPQRPVEMVNHQEAADYCAAAGGLRLPTEAEWEYAARAGSTAARYGNLDEVAWHNGSNGTHEVGKKLANAWGLHDMLGNVWEWTADWYHVGYYKNSPNRDPVGPSGATAAARVLRGGSWVDFPTYVRVSYRDDYAPAVRFNVIGFRCAGEFR